MTRSAGNDAKQGDELSRDLGEANGVIPPSPRPDSRTTLGLLTLYAAALVGLTFVLYWLVWLVQQFDILAGGTGSSPWFGLIVTVIHSAMVAVPAWLISRRVSSPRPKAIIQTWIAAGLFILFCIPIRFAPLAATQLGALLQIACAGAFLLLGLRLFPASANSRATSPYWPAILAAALVSIPWVLYGAAGSWLDSTLNLVAALMLGAAAAGLFRWRLLPALASTDESFRNDIGVAGYGMGAVLAIMGGAYGLNGQQLILTCVLASIGLLLAAVAGAGRHDRFSGGWAATGLLASLVAAGPMILVDPAEMLLILNAGVEDNALWIMLATLLSVIIALLLGTLAIWYQRYLPAVSSGSKVGAIATTLSVGLLAGLYLITGQPGFHGEKLFVVMEEQIAWDSFEPPDDYRQRREDVYEDLVGQSDRTQSHIRQTLDRFGVDYTPYYLTNAIEVDGGPLIRLWLETQSEVDRVLSSPQLRPLPRPPNITLDSAEPPAEPQWNLTSIGAPDVWQDYGVSGEGIVVGQADSGVELSHPELTDSYRGNQPSGPPGNDYNWFDPWSHSKAPIDFGGHGTHTLGTMVGQTVGVAPGADWIACVNLERNLGNPALYLDCMQFLFAPFPLDGNPLRNGRPELGAHVLNNSWGCPVIEGCDPNALLAAVQALRAAGVFVVASAGNEGSACSTVESPIALYDEVFSVGAVDSLGQLAFFSSRGPVTADGSGRVKPDIVAPGVDVLSSYPSGTYSYSDGTSMAGPHVVGVVALMWSANPALIGNIDLTEALLTNSAQPYDYDLLGVPNCGNADAVPDNATGYGLVDAFAAVRAALALSP